MKIVYLLCALVALGKATILPETETGLDEVERLVSAWETSDDIDRVKRDANRGVT